MAPPRFELAFAPLTVITPATVQMDGSPDLKLTDRAIASLGAGQSLAFSNLFRDPGVQTAPGFQIPVVSMTQTGTDSPALTMDSGRAVVARTDPLPTVTEEAPSESTEETLDLSAPSSADLISELPGLDRGSLETSLFRLLDKVPIREAYQGWMTATATLASLLAGLLALEVVHRGRWTIRRRPPIIVRPTRGSRPFD